MGDRQCLGEAALLLRDKVVVNKKNDSISVADDIIAVEDAKTLGQRHLSLPIHSDALEAIAGCML